MPMPKSGGSGRCPGGQAERSEDLGNHGGMFDGGEDLQDTTPGGTLFHIASEHAFEQPGPAHAGRPQGRWRLTGVS